MDASSVNRPAFLLCGLALLAVLTGLVVSWLEPQWAIAGIFGAAAVGMVLYDYRIGVVCLTLMLPWFSSPLIPQARGFNLINFLVLASIGSLVARRGFPEHPRISEAACGREDLQDRDELPLGAGGAGGRERGHCGE